ncbi:hypothetical protein DPMN_191884 [Dreissena polymorpha]|uniref:Uncharacterized protein n=1 Tax=Dreissena polymorpha TaxID=45954 RepID=A0A9D3Y1H1_DREPO|nr:hypothetical protein DPMN_191884 [Dreissena polymorpha]
MPAYHPCCRRKPTFPDVKPSALHGYHLPSSKHAFHGSLKFFAILWHGFLVYGVPNSIIGRFSKDEVKRLNISCRRKGPAIGVLGVSTVLSCIPITTPQRPKRFNSFLVRLTNAVKEPNRYSTRSQKKQLCEEDIALTSPAPIDK